MVYRRTACGAVTRNCEAVHQKEKDQSPMVSRFFKVILDEEEDSKFLYLPPKFARRTKHVAGQEIEIEDSCGRRWSVTVTNVNGSLAFAKGWHKFYLDHHLQVGSFLVFNYIEGSHFNVQLYDRSACEKIKFDNERAQPNKRPRRDLESTPNSVAAVAPGPDVSTPLVPPSTDMEELVSMVNRDYGYDQGKDRTFLYDLSSFEMGKQPSIGNAFKNGLDKKHSPSPAPIMEPTDNFTNVLDTKMAPSHAEIMEPVDYFGNVLDSKIAFYHAEALGHADKSEKIPETETVPASTENMETNVAVSHAVSVDQTKAREADIKMAATCTDDDIPVDNALNQPSDNTNLVKDTRNDVPKFQYSDYPVSASVTETTSSGSSKDVVHRFWESSVSSQARENTFDSRPIKKEQVELDGAAHGLPNVPSRKEPTMVRKHGQMFSPAVKVEPDLVPLVCVPPFTSEVKSLSYLELPVHVPSIPGRREKKGRGKAVYLRDPAGRLWPVLYPAIPCGKALTSNWRKFCMTNKIKVGDVCKFEVENVMTGIYKVVVKSRSG